MAEFIIVVGVVVGLFGIIDMYGYKSAPKSWFYTVLTIACLGFGIYLKVKAH